MPDQGPRPYGEALEIANGGDGGRTDGREGQPVVQNCALSSREVDSKRVAEGVRVFKGR